MRIVYVRCGVSGMIRTFPAAVLFVPLGGYADGRKGATLRTRLYEGKHISRVIVSM